MPTPTASIILQKIERLKAQSLEIDRDISAWMLATRKLQARMRKEGLPKSDMVGYRFEIHELSVRIARAESRDQWIKARLKTLGSQLAGEQTIVFPFYNEVHARPSAASHRPKVPVLSG